MAFRNKTEKILTQKPDLLFVQECEKRVVDELEKYLPECNQALWSGDNQHKGLGIFSFDERSIKIAAYYNPLFRYVIPIEVDQYLFFHIWAMPNEKNKKQSYVGQIWAALQHYQNHIDEQTILVGDFNSHVQWDSERPEGNHSSVVAFLEEKNIVSAYHHVNQIKPGAEPDPSIYLLKQKQKPYHLDYCFVPLSMISKKTTVSIGQFDDWIKLSDHMPLVVNGLEF